MTSKPKPTRETRKPIVKASPLSEKKAGKKRRVKTTRQKLVRALDTIVREIVFERDQEPANLIYRDLIDEETGEVQVMKTDVNHPGHIISRARMSVRWDLRNVHKQNAAHNLLHEFYPEVFNQWYITNFGLASWNELVDDSKKVSTYSIAELETLLFNLTEIQKDAYFRYFSQKDIVREDFCQKYGFGSFGL